MKTFQIGKFYIIIWQQWSTLLKPSNYSWLEFTFIHLEIVNSPYKCSKEITLALLGIGLELLYHGERND